MQSHICCRYDGEESEGEDLMDADIMRRDYQEGQNVIIDDVVCIIPADHGGGGGGDEDGGDNDVNDNDI